MLPRNYLVKGIRLFSAAPRKHGGPPCFLGIIGERDWVVPGIIDERDWVVPGIIDEKDWVVKGIQLFRVASRKPAWWTTMLPGNYPMKGVSGCTQ